MRSGRWRSIHCPLTEVAFPSNGTMQSLPSTSYISLVKSTKVRNLLLAWHLVLTSGAGGGKGRAAFCQAPVVAKEKRKETDYSEYPLTNHGDMLMALVQSGISRYPNRTVVMQFFETAARYGDFFKIRKECIMPTLEAFVDPR